MMINVTYSRRDTTLTVKGHALAAPKGKDLICAAASILAFTVLEIAEENAEKFLPSVLMENDSADFRIVCNPSDGQLGRCRDVLDTVFTGFEILANEYPEYVRVTKEE